MSEYAVHSRIARVVSGVLALVGASGAAWGSYIGAADMKYQGVGMGQNVRIDVGGSVQTVFAGEIVFQIRYATGAAAQFDSLTLPTFCVEPTQHVQSGWRSYALTDTDSAATPMMDAGRAEALSTVATYFYSQRSAGAIDNDAAAGFQLVLWEIMRDYDEAAGRASLDLAGGSFKATGSNGAAFSAPISNWIDQFLDVATTSAIESPWAFVLSSATSQDQIIPGPGGMALAYAGLFMIVSRRRRA